MFPTLAQCVALMAAAELSVRTIRLETLARRFGAELVLDDRAPLMPPAGTELSMKERKRLNVLAKVARHWPFPPGGACLRHSLAASYMLRARHPQLRLGVNRGTGPMPSVMAHAWTEIEGVPVTPAGEHAPLRYHRPLAVPSGIANGSGRPL